LDEANMTRLLASDVPTHHTSAPGVFATMDDSDVRRARSDVASAPIHPEPP
jgi:hypothetical protein